MEYRLKQKKDLKYGFLKTNHMKELEDKDSDYSYVTLV